MSLLSGFVLQDPAKSLKNSLYLSFSLAPYLYWRVFAFFALEFGIFSPRSIFPICFVLFCFLDLTQRCPGLNLDQVRRP